MGLLGSGLAHGLDQKLGSFSTGTAGTTVNVTADSDNVTADSEASYAAKTAAGNSTVDKWTRVAQFVKATKFVQERLEDESHLNKSEIEPKFLARIIVSESFTHGLSPWLVYSVIKVESQFRTDAKGEAGEIGLMQILPSTAAMIATRRFGQSFRENRLWQPSYNVKLGTAHLGYLLRRYEGKVVPALSTYNSGSPYGEGYQYALRVLNYYRNYAPKYPVDSYSAEQAASQP